MKIVLAAYGSRGDVEPSVVVGRELQRRGHDVQLAVPPELVGFAEAAGLPAVSYGLDTQTVVEAQRNYWTCIFHSPWKVRELRKMSQDIKEINARWSKSMTDTLVPLAGVADILSTGITFDQPAADVAELYNIPMATLDYYPIRANGQLVPFLPGPVIRFGWTKTRSAARWASRKQNGPRPYGLLDDAPWKSRPTTKCGFRGWLQSGQNSMAGAPLSAR
jgi:UDP:flavonoid glycosyltransferase YjiC (YdhE family)